MAENIPSSADRTQLFAQIDLAVNGVTLITQVFITSALLRRAGLVFCLILLPILAVITLGVTASVAHAGGDFGLLRHPPRLRIRPSASPRAKSSSPWFPDRNATKPRA